jgi:uncharacterized protein YfdQ (DUF2303 family)
MSDINDLVINGETVSIPALPETVPLGAGDEGTFLLPPGWTTQNFDGEHLLSQPRRTVGTVEAFTADGFKAAVSQRRENTAPVPVYLDEESFSLIAVLNDDLGMAAGWRDNRVSLALRRTKEWREWQDVSGKWLDQDTLAEFIEQHQLDIVTPEPAVMLELAQHFHATTTSRFQQGQRLANGQRTFQYAEDTAATAGKGGTLEIPEEFEIAVKPFVGGTTRYKLRVLFHYRVREAKLSLSVALVRPEDTLRKAFLDTCTEILEAPEGETQQWVRIEGRPASER